MNLPAVAKLKLDFFVPGHSLEITSRRIPIGASKETVEQIIVRGDLPKWPITSQRETIDRKTGVSTFTEEVTTPSSAFLSASLAIFRAAQGISTFHVNERTWLDLTVMKYDDIEDLKKLGLHSKTIQASADKDGKTTYLGSKLEGKDREVFLVGIEGIFTTNNLNSFIVNLSERNSQDHKLLVRINTAGLSEKDIIKADLIANKLNGAFGEFSQTFLDRGVRNWNC